MEVLAGAGVMVVSFVVGWFLRPYFVKRSEQQAEYDAILNNLGTIQKKVEVTERAAAEIKSEVEQKGWHERERIVLMRSKLEATFLAAFELREAVDRLQGTMMDDNPRDDVDIAANRLEMLTTLYFPTLRVAAAALRLMGNELAVSIRDVHVNFRVYVTTRAVDPKSTATANALTEFEQHRAAHLIQLADRLKRLRAALMNFTDAAAAEMSKYAP
jgi:hypothetical protein